MSLDIGEQVGQYKIVAQIGAGGMASVYQAYHARLDRHVAIKVMHPNMLNDPGFHARFEREARIVARLEHPNIVSVYDFEEYKNQPYLVMRFVEGQTLKDKLRDGMLSPSETLTLMTHLADALTYAHKRGVLHRDLKPSNIIIDADGTPYLTDFGLARIAGAGESTMSADVMLGTPQYISPEQAKGGTDIDARTDVYSFGIMLYELLTGSVPYRGDTPYSIVHDHIYTPLPPPRAINPEMPEAAEQVLIKALAKQPKDRYDTPTELMNDLRRAYAGEQIAPETVTRETAPIATSLIASPMSTSEREDTAHADPISEKEYKRRKVEIRAALDSSQINRREYRHQRRVLKSTYRKGMKDAKKAEQALEEANLTPEQRLRRRVEERIEKRREAFGSIFGNFVAFVFIGVFIFDLEGWITMVTSGGGLVPQGFGQWIPLIWAIGLLSQIISYYYEHGPGAQRRAETIQREYEREYSRLYGDHAGLAESSAFKVKNDDLFIQDESNTETSPTGRIRLTGDGEFTDSYIAELRDDDQQQAQSK
ncbi:MAG: protein kinase [Aggregatilineales bacterium]